VETLLSNPHLSTFELKPPTSDLEALPLELEPFSFLLELPLFELKILFLKLKPSLFLLHPSSSELQVSTSAVEFRANSPK
jgi:hypothetical protein